MADSNLVVKNDDRGIGIRVIKNSITGTLLHLHTCESLLTGDYSLSRT
jgi:hypothetical protein